ncbi:ScbA/BarX family gamma-butyrolactone biosynthesis protein [Streptomyces sp. NPDC050619]|uniref:ScbA/BarX family gamma-butyrolactone biosynthesis protein n=1 Tax=Streptomyces sp. NPDC050619 TaxID=3157214 RepID=UPI0034405017
MTTVAAQATLDDSDPSFMAKLGEYTHLRDSDAILVRSRRRQGADDFTLTVHWPATGGPGPYDPRLLAQTVRQTGLAVAHAEYGVPTTHQTLLRALDITVEPGLLAVEGSAFEVDVAVTRTAGRSRSSLAMGFRIHQHGVLVGRADTEFDWVSPAAYERVRGRYLTVDWGRWPLPRPVAPRLVARADDIDVLLAAGAGDHRWQLRNDVSNTLLFDHPVDHVPGLVLVEAAWQAAHAYAAPARFELGDIAITYERYVEFGEPCWIEARPLPAPAPGRIAVEVTGHQSGRQAFGARLSGLRHHL